MSKILQEKQGKSVILHGYFIVYFWTPSYHKDFSLLFIFEIWSNYRKRHKIKLQEKFWKLFIIYLYILSFYRNKNNFTV